MGLGTLKPAMPSTTGARMMSLAARESAKRAAQSARDRVRAAALAGVKLQNKKVETEKTPQVPPGLMIIDPDLITNYAEYRFVQDSDFFPYLTSHVKVSQHVLDELADHKAAVIQAEKDAMDLPQFAVQENKKLEALATSSSEGGPPGRWLCTFGQKSTSPLDYVSLGFVACESGVVSLVDTLPYEHFAATVDTSGDAAERGGPSAPTTVSTLDSLLHPDDQFKVMGVENEDPRQDKIAAEVRASTTTHSIKRGREDAALVQSSVGEPDDNAVVKNDVMEKAKHLEYPWQLRLLELEGIPLRHDGVLPTEYLDDDGPHGFISALGNPPPAILPARSLDREAMDRFIEFGDDGQDEEKDGLETMEELENIDDDLTSTPFVEVLGIPDASGEVALGIALRESPPPFMLED